MHYDTILTYNFYLIVCSTLKNGENEKGSSCNDSCSGQNYDSVLLHRKIRYKNILSKSNRNLQLILIKTMLIFD